MGRKRKCYGEILPCLGDGGYVDVWVCMILKKRKY